MATVVAAPNRSAKAPASSAPRGAIPMNIIEYMAITRPRRESGTIDWIRVLDAAICVIMAYPTGTSSATASQSVPAPEGRRGSSDRQGSASARRRVFP